MEYDQEKLIAFAKYEQRYLLDDLSEALRVANNGIWSMGCDVALWRLVNCLRVVGPVSYDFVPWVLLGSEIWTTILTLAKLPTPSFTEEIWDRLSRRLVTFGGTRYELLAKYELTRATLPGLSIWGRSDGS